MCPNVHAWNEKYYDKQLQENQQKIKTLIELNLFGQGRIMMLSNYIIA